MRYVFIINPVAGKTNRTDMLKTQIEALGLGDKAKICVTEAVGDARRIARLEAETGDEIRIYSCGGDGTANEVMSGIAGYDNCAMGIIPIGSGNDFIRALTEFCKDDFLDVKRMTEGRVRSIDLLECGGRYAMNIFSVGFDCSVANNVARFKKLPFVSGSLAYKLSIVYCLFTKRKFKIRVWVDDERLERADYNKTTLLAIGGNGNYYGGGIKAAPLASLDDGLMDFVHVETISVPRFLSLLGKYTKGQHINNPKYPFVYFKRCKKIKFTAEEPLDVNFDGEILVMKDPEITILPKALRIIEPA